MERGFERVRRDRQKMHAGRGFAVGRGVLGIDDGVGQSADLAAIGTAP